MKCLTEEIVKLSRDADLLQLRQRGSLSPNNEEVQSSSYYPRPLSTSFDDSAMSVVASELETLPSSVPAVYESPDLSSSVDYGAPSVIPHLSDVADDFQVHFSLSRSKLDYANLR
jgi:hypothetical protein